MIIVAETMVTIVVVVDIAEREPVLKEGKLVG